MGPLVLTSEILNVIFSQRNMCMPMDVLIHELTNILVTQNGIQSEEVLPQCYIYGTFQDTSLSSY